MKICPQEKRTDGHDHDNTLRLKLAEG